MSGTDCCSVHSIVIWRGSSPAPRTRASSAGGVERGIEQAEGRQVDRVPARLDAGVPAVGLEAADLLEHGRDDVHVELDAAVRVDRRLHDRADRLRQHRHVRAEQALVLVQPPRGELDDRLERDPVELPQAEEVVEHLGLDDLGGLGHPDPLGEAGQLHRRGHRDQVAVALRERVVDRDEAVLGPVGATCDVVGEALRELVGGADEDHPGLEVEDSPFVQTRCHAAHEADVARPQEALVAHSPRRREEPHGPIMRPCPAGPWHPPVTLRMVRSYGLIPLPQAAGRRSPARIAMSSRFSGGASGHAQRGSKAHDGWNAKLKSRIIVPVAGSPPRSALFAASTR